MQRYKKNEYLSCYKGTKIDWLRKRTKEGSEGDIQASEQSAIKVLPNSRMILIKKVLRLGLKK